jgi:hypothetical protein
MISISNKHFTIVSLAVLLLSASLSSADTTTEGQNITGQIAQDGLESLSNQPLVLLSIDFRVKKDKDDFPLHIFSFIFLEVEDPFISFCGVLDFSEDAESQGAFPFCADPLKIDYVYHGKELCLEANDSNESEVNGCYLPEYHDLVIDWRRNGEPVAFSTFLAFPTPSVDPHVGAQMKAVTQALSEEADTLSKDENRVSGILEKLGFHHSLPLRIGAQERAEMARFQEDSGLIPTGFLDDATSQALAE